MATTFTQALAAVKAMGSMVEEHHTRIHVAECGNQDHFMLVETLGAPEHQRFADEAFGTSWLLLYINHYPTTTTCEVVAELTGPQAQEILG